MIKLGRNYYLKVSLFLFWLLQSGLIAASQTFEAPPIFIAQGEQRIIRIAGLKKYSLGGQTIRVMTGKALDKNDADALLLKGITVGPSDIWVWKTDGSTEHRTIHVEKVNPIKHNSRLDEALSRLEETEIIISGAGYVIRGEIGSLAECARIAALVKGFPQEVVDETTSSKSLLETGTRNIENWLKSSKYNNKLILEHDDQTISIKGTIEDPTERRTVDQKLRAIFPLVKTDLLSMPDLAPTIHFRVFLLEIKISKMSSLGLSWPANQAAAFRVTSGRIEQTLQLDVALQALEGDGSARILSRPEIAVRVPGEAELFSGGELPIRTSSQYSSNVQWKNFGLTLKLKAETATSSKVRLDIFTEVSHLDENIAGDAIPGLQANRLKTQVDAQFGQPLFLSGLLQEGIREQAKGLPFLRQIPVLGALFGSEDYLNERSELVAVLVPKNSPPTGPLERIVRSFPTGPAPLPRNWISPQKVEELTKSEDYPWNALQ